MSSPVLAAKDLVFGYRGSDAPVVDVWSADFPANSVTALTGTSGCGKSTRLYLLGLLLKPGGGSIELSGTRVDHLGDRIKSGLRASRFGFVFQDAALDSSRSVLDNVLESSLYRGERRLNQVARAKALLDEFELDVPYDRRPGEVSGGQAQRIALCRALMGNPAVVLADEPTGNLDSSTSQFVLDGLRGCADRGAAVVVVTHDQSVATFADSVISFGRTS